MRHNEVLANLHNLTNIKPTQQKLADILGEKIGTIGARAMRNSQYSFEEIQKIGDFYNVDLLQNCIKSSLINSYHGQDKVIKLAPIEASCGNGLTIDTSMINSYDPNAQYTFAIAKGTSMQPTIYDKDLVIVKKYDGNFIDGVYLFNIGDEMFIKRLSKNINQLVCMSDNKDFDKIILKGDELDTVSIIGMVVTVIRNI